MRRRLESHRALGVDERTKGSLRLLEQQLRLKAEIDRLDDHKTDRFKLGKMLEEIGKTLQEK